MNGTFPGGEVEGEVSEGGYEELGVIERTERSIRVRRSEGGGRAYESYDMIYRMWTMTHNLWVILGFNTARWPC